MVGTPERKASVIRPGHSFTGSRLGVCPTCSGVCYESPGRAQVCVFLAWFSWNPFVFTGQSLETLTWSRFFTVFCQSRDEVSLVLLNTPRETDRTNSWSLPHLDPCLPPGYQRWNPAKWTDAVPAGDRGTLTCAGRPSSLSWTKRTRRRPPSTGSTSLQFTSRTSEFYASPKFYYCTEDVLRMGGDYGAAAFTKSRQGNCRGSWCR